MNRDYRVRYAEAKRQQLSAAGDTPEAVEWRRRDKLIRERAVQERTERFPVLTPENALEAMDWQTARIKQLHAAPTPDYELAEHEREFEHPRDDY